MEIHSLTLGLARAYLVETQKGLALIDAGSPGQEQRVLRLMQTIGRDDLRLIFITHSHLDHYGSAQAIRAHTGAPIAVHQSDAQAMQQGDSPLGTVRGWAKINQFVLPLFKAILRLPPTSPDIIVTDDQLLDGFGLSARVIHTPGHTAGSCCLLLEDRLEGRIVFAGDLVSTTGKPHTQRFYAHNWSQLPASLDHLKALQPEWVYPGHGMHPVSGGDLGALETSPA